MPDWASTYRRYRTVERAWHAAISPQPLAAQFFRRIVHAFQTDAAIRREIASFGLEPPSDLIGEALALQRELDPPDRQRPEGRHPDDPLEDVYAAALSMLPHGFWVVSPGREQLYRGQRNATWATVPSLFRTADPDAALERLAQALPRIQACLPDASQEQLVAVAQHYAKELDVHTWLLDMTFDPRVALFFASDGGRSGDIGMVVCVVRREWERLSAGGSNRLGRLRVIEAPGVMRIEHQRASFLDTSHPDLFDQYVGHTVWFRQVDGLRFEDAEADFPVTAASIYPAADPLREALLRARAGGDGELRWRPASDTREPLDGRAYRAIADSWCREAGVAIDPCREDTLDIVCDVHAALQQRRDLFERPERSLARLQDAVERIIEAQRGGRRLAPREALEGSLGRLAPSLREPFEALIATIESARHGR